MIIINLEINNLQDLFTCTRHDLVFKFKQTFNYLLIIEIIKSKKIKNSITMKINSLSKGASVSRHPKKQDL
jgi:hypothetical protein